MKANKPDYVHGTFQIATTDILQFEHADFVEQYISEHPECTISEIPNEKSEQFFEWCCRTTSINWEEDLNSIETCPQYDTPVILEGLVARWDAKYRLFSEMYDSVIAAVRKIITNGCDDYDIHYEDGAIKISGRHHDGTNSYVIRGLSKKGISKINTAERNYVENPILKSHDYKRLPYLFAI